MAEETQYEATTGMVTISTANSNLDGTGTIETVLTAASDGTLIKSITVKAQVNTTQGMVRLFIYDTSNTRLVSEIEIPAVTKSATDPAFEITIPVEFALKSGWSLKASTENAETFNVIAEGLSWSYYSTSVRPESSNYTANCGMAVISTANSNLDGTGTIGTVLTATADIKGTVIQSIIIKSQETTEAGMIRLFLYDGSNTKLFKEISVEATTQTGTAHSFSKRVDFDGQGFALADSWLLKASTEKGDTFNVIAEGLDWEYPA
ncbi:MAG: hypothetical protein ABIJ97_00130 [Bacteroidota bacterium]